MNLCWSCGLDFGSVEAFDAHRVGRHAYSYSEGLAFVSPVEDGRRCLHVSEISDARARDGSERFWWSGERQRWSLARSVHAAGSLRVAA